MSNLKLVDKVNTSRLLVIFVVIGLLWSILVFLPQIAVFDFSLKFFDILFFLYLIAPSVITVLSLIAMYKKIYLNSIFWLSFIYWVLISAGELLEGAPYSPNFTSLLIILMLSISAASVKLISNKANQR